MSPYRRPFGSRPWFILGLAAIGLGLAALPSQPAPGGAPKALTPAQRARLKERANYEAESRKLDAEGKVAGAIAAAQKVLAIEREVYGDAHDEVAGTLQWLAEMYATKEDFPAARKAAKEALAMFIALHGADHWQVTDARGHLADVERLAGLPWEQRAQLAHARRLNHQLMTLWRQGKAAKAVPLARQAVDIRRTLQGEKHPLYATSLNNLALMYQETGDYARAEPLLWQALEIYQRARGEEHPDYATGLNNLACCTTPGRSPRGPSPCCGGSWRSASGPWGRSTPTTPAALTTWPRCTWIWGSTSGQNPCSGRPWRSIKKTLGDKHRTYATGLNNLAVLYRAAGDDAKAEPVLRQAAQLLHEHLQLTAAVQSERQQLALLRDLRRALDDYVALAPQAAGSVERLYAQVLAWKGAVFARQRHARDTRRLLAQSPRPEVRQLHARLEEVSRPLATLALAASAPTAEVRQALEQLTNLKEQLERDLAGRSAAFRRQQQQARLTPAGLQKLLPADAVLIDFLEYRRFTPPKPKTVGGTWESRLAAFVVRPGRPVERLDLGPMGPITRAVGAWRKHFGLGAAGKDDPAGAKLRKLVWRPLAAKMAGARLVLVAPDGALGRFPFAALPGSSPGSYLLEEVALAVLPVPQLLPQLLAAPDAADKAGPSLLLVGEVDYDAAADTATAAPSPGLPAGVRTGTLGQMKALPGTRAEVLAIQDSFQDRFPQAKRTVLRKKAAAEGAVRREAPKHRYLHFATHGFFAPPKLRSALDAPFKADGQRGSDLFNQQGVSGFHPGLLSGLVLAGANRAAVSPDEDDGILTALEVASLDLGGVELAVLSACETGLGEAAGGEGLLGLQRAFQVAGARAVVASLWQVDDKATRALMEDFYANLWGKKLTKLEALRQAQLTMLREGLKRGLGEPEQAKGRRLPPYYWGAFVLSGDWR